MALALAAAAAVAGAGVIIPDDACQPCDVAATCDTLACKVPPIGPVPTGTGLEQGLDNATKTAFERLVGHGLRDSAAAAWATDEFISRILRALYGARGDGNRTAAVEAAFVLPWADWKQNAGYTGYVGPDVTAIRSALEGGNIRERWGLVYVLTKSNGFTAAVRPIADRAFTTKDTSQLDALGLNAAAVLSRRALVAATEVACARPGASG
eukprot:gene32282-2353_t